MFFRCNFVCFAADAAAAAQSTANLVCTQVFAFEPCMHANTHSGRRARPDSHAARPRCDSSSLSSSCIVYKYISLHGGLRHTFITCIMRYGAHTETFTLSTTNKLPNLFSAKRRTGEKKKQELYSVAANFCWLRIFALSLRLRGTPSPIYGHAFLVYLLVSAEEKNNKSLAERMCDMKKGRVRL